MKLSPADIQSEFDREGGSRSPIQIEDIVIGATAKEELLRFLQKKCWKHPVIVCDRNTYEAAGRVLADELKAGGVKAAKLIIPEHEAGTAAADERTLVYTLINIAEETDVIIAAGSGTIHDITRFAVYIIPHRSVSRRFYIGGSAAHIKRNQNDDSNESADRPLCGYESFKRRAPFNDSRGIRRHARKNNIAGRLGDIPQACR